MCEKKSSPVSILVPDHGGECGIFCWMEKRELFSFLHRCLFMVGTLFLLAFLRKTILLHNWYFELRKKHAIEKNAASLCLCNIRSLRFMAYDFKLSSGRQV